MKKTKLLPELLPDEVINIARSFNSTLLADAIGLSAGMDYGIKPVASGMKIVGTAMTVSLKPGDNLFLHHAIYSGSKGYILIADGKGHTENAYLGELMAGAAKAVGLEGIVVDGCVRDKEALTELGFPVYARGFVPNGPYKDGPGEFNLPVSCGGVIVNPGDLVVADADGVVIVPRDNILDVFERAEKKNNYEAERIHVIKEYAEKLQRGIKDNAIEPSWLNEKMKLHGF